jgi:methionyl-tRNA synthetase
LREVPLGNDGDFTFESLFGRFNAELANDLGNLVNRSLTLITKFAAEHPPKRDDSVYGQTENPFWQLESVATEVCVNAARQFEAIAPSRALELIWRFVGVANRFIDQTQPWAMAKAKDPALSHTLWALQASLYFIARLVAPVLPATSSALRKFLGDTDPKPLTWPTTSDGRVLDEAPASLVAQPPQPLFPRLDDKAQARILNAVVGDAAAAPATPAAPTKTEKHAAPPPPTPATNAVTIDDFGKIELRAGKVLTAQAVPKAKKLLHLSVDLGEAQPRSIVAGIAEAYTPEQMVGKQVIVVANLAPATIRGIRSEGMILAAGDEAIVGLSALDRDVPPGTRVR